MKDSTTLSHLPAVSDTPSRLPSESVSDLASKTVSDPLSKPLSTPLPKPVMSMSKDAKMGLLITLVAMIGVVIWVVVELSLYQH